MNQSVKNIMVRVIKNRVNNGEKLENIILDYPKLTDSEIQEIKNAL